jgi:hypothetical protein
MADLIAADVIVTQTGDDEEYIGQRTNRMHPKITFGDGSKTYPTNGVPLPSLIKFRLHIYIKWINIIQIPGDYEYVWDEDHGTVRIYSRATGAEFSGAVSETTLRLEIMGA